MSMISTKEFCVSFFQKKTFRLKKLHSAQNTLKKALQFKHMGERFKGNPLVALDTLHF